MQLKGKAAIVTGGARGIGLQIVTMLVEHGATAGVIDSDADTLAKLGGEAPIIAAAGDVSDPDSVDAALDCLLAQLEGPDLLINNAAIVHNAPLVGIADGRIVQHARADWDRVIATNLSGVFHVTAAVVQRMVAQRRRGLIINISSICAAGNAGQSAYSASKAGVNALTVTWARELAPWGIRVAALAPGFVDTETTVRSLRAETVDEWKKRTLVRRMGTANEIAAGVRFIIENDFFNGRILELDGGLRL